MLSTNFIETAKNTMNEVAEVSRNIGLLEQSIHMTNSPSQADAADFMISEETGRKRQLLNHLRELSEECSDRRNEIAALRNSAIQEAMTYARIAAKFQAANNQESYEEALKMRNKARKEYDDYSVAAEQLANLSTEINNTLAGESFPRLLPLTSLADLPFESAVAISADRFQAILDTVDVIPTVEQYMQRDIDSILSDVNEGFNSAKICICSAIGSEVWESEDLTDAEKEAFELALATQFEAVAEHLEEVRAVSQLPSQRRINANIGIRA